MQSNNIKYIVFIAALLFFAACSTTSHLPEDEILYTGISEIAYGHKAAQKRNKQSVRTDSVGVITTLSDAYSAVSGLLTGAEDSDERLRRLLKDRDSHLTDRQRDSLRHEIEAYDQATSAVREEIEVALAAAPNNSILGSSSVRWPLPIGLWIYNSFVDRAEKGFGKWMFNSFAATPVFISTVNPQLRSQVAQNTLRNFGFFRGRVEHEVLQQKNPRKAKVAYSVYPGPLFKLGKIEYMHFNNITDSLMAASANKSELHTGDAFSVLNLDAERKRLSTLFRNNGFYYFRPEYIQYRADTINTPYTVGLQVRPNPKMPAQANNRYYMGRTRITILRNDDPFEITDSIVPRRSDDFTMRWHARKGDRKKDGRPRTPLRLGAIRHNLFYQRGSLYRNNIHEFMQDKLTGMGIFSNVRVNYVPRDTSATCDTLDVEVFGILDKQYDSELEAKVTNKSNGLLGPGISWGMTKRNALRGAETVNFKVYGSYEWQTGVDARNSNNGLINSFELGAAMTLTYPRLKFFGLARPLNRRAQASTVYKFDIDWMNRASYFQMVSLGGRIAYTYQRKRRIKHELVPFRLDYDLLVRRTATFDSIMNANQALYVSMRDQFVPSMSYTMTYSTTKRDTRNQAFILSAKEAGNVISGIYAIAGRPWLERNKGLFGVPFAQYLKLTAEYRQTFPITSRSSIAARAMAGVVWSYGNSTMAPYSDLFNVGGANSIRAFGVRTIGPGSYHPAGSGWSYVDQVGDFKLEANVEYRFPIISSLYGAVFLDAGNVWLLEADDSRPGGNLGSGSFWRQIALGTGVGLRYDFDFLVLRFDIGVGLHAPYDTGKKGYYNMHRFGDSLGFHIAVGYPF